MTNTSPDIAESPQAEGRSHFTLREMLLAVTALAALLAFLRVFGIFGALFVWGAILLYSVLLQRRNCGARAESSVDFLWGVVMPAVCLVFDPGFFHSAGGMNFEHPGHWHDSDAMLVGGRPILYAAVELQMAMLAVWLLLGAAAEKAGDFFAGVFGVGAVIAGTVGLVMLPITVLGIFAMLLGLLGTTPWFTAWAYWRQCQRALAIAGGQLGRSRRLASVAAGVAFAVAVPVLAGMAASSMRTP